MFDSIDRTSETALGEAVDTDRLAAHVDRFAGLHRSPGSETSGRPPGG